MSRGPGRIERAIRELLNAHPDLAFFTDELVEHCYPGVEPIERKHRVSVLRAARGVLDGDPDWGSTWSWTLGNTLIFYNQASLSGAVMAHVLRRFGGISTRERVLSLTRQVLHPEKPWQREYHESCECKVRDHVALRDADPAERERLTAQRQVDLAHLATSIRSALGKPQVLSNAHDAPSTILNPDALADRIRALMEQNDPDVLRAGLASVAEELDGRGGAA